MIKFTHYTPNGNSIDTTGGVCRSADGGTNWDNLTGDLEIDQSTTESLYPQFPTDTFSQFHQMAVDPNKSTRTTLTLPFNVAGLKQFSIMPDCVGQHWNDASA